MRILESDVSLRGSSKSVKWRREEESFVYWRGGEDARKLAYDKPVELSLSPEARKMLSDLKDSPEAASSALSFGVANGIGRSQLANLIPKIDVKKSSAKGKEDNSFELSLEDRLKLRLIEELAYRLTGKRIKLKVPGSGDAETEKGKTASEGIQDAIAFKGELPQAQGGESPQSVGWGLDYNYSSTEYESETATFSAKGTVKTADGREISLQAALEMSRESLKTESLSIKAGDALIDPLVINFEGAAAELSDSTVSFDLKAGGSDEKIHALREGSGFLALDKNSNSKIDDGSELFGPATGDGFSELSNYDDDGNGWIDEGDSVFAKLQVWRIDESGKEWRASLSSLGIGAIYLGSAATKFSIAGDADPSQVQGVLKETGVYLKEDGGVGTVQELDLAAAEGS